MKQNLTELVFILDRSGSMNGLEQDTIGGFNAMLEKQKKEAGECRITTVLFDHRYDLLHDRIDICGVRPLTDNEYYVGGTTALLDAIGKTICKIKTAQKNTAQGYRANKVLFVIITDGYENASQHYTVEQVKKEIQYQQQKCGWDFIFLGANIDAIKTANQFGICVDHAANYVPDQEGTRLNYEVVSDTISTYRAGGQISGRSLNRIRSDQNTRGGSPHQKIVLHAL